MSKKKLTIIAIFFILVSLLISFNTPKEEIIVNLSDPSYSYLPESARNFIENEAKKGNKILTEKNKEPKQVYLNPKYVEYLNMSASEKAELEVIPQIYSFDYVATNSVNEEFDSYYKLENLIVKNQLNLGACWSFATISSIETNILQTGLSDTPVYLAERQMDYAMSDNLKETTNPYALSILKKNLNTLYNLNDHILGSGASFADLYLYLNMGISPVKEEIWGGYDNSLQSRSISEVLNYDNVDYQVTGYNFYNDNIYGNSDYLLSDQEDFMKNIKHHIVNYGSLYIATVSPDNNAGPCYDSSKNIINYDDTNLECKNGTIHALSIVGWDDSYEGGAWILKNSWGNKLPYVYLDYESVFYNIMGVTKVEFRNWDNGYNITKTNTSNFSSTNYEITYYKSSEFGENLEKINFISWGIDASYRVSYKNGNGSYTIIDTVHNDFPGLITVNVGNVVLDKDRFTIKVEALDERGRLEEGLNVFTSNISEEKYLEIYEFNGNQILPKQLVVRNVPSGIELNYYIFDETGRKYNNDETSYVINGTVDIDYDLPQLENKKYYLTLDETLFDVTVIKKLEMKIDTNYRITYDVGSKLTIESVTYSSSDTSVATVNEDGLIEAVGFGKTIVTLKVNDVITKEIEVDVLKELLITNLDLIEENEKIYLSLQSEMDLHVNIEPQIYSLEELNWETSNSNVLEVQNGHVTFLNAGNATVTVSSGSLSDSVNFRVIHSTSNITLTASKTTIAVNESVEIKRSRRTPGYRWVSSDESIAVVNNGIVTVLKNVHVGIYYQNNNSVNGIEINVVDPDELMNLRIYPNGGTYDDSKEMTIISGNSLSNIDLLEPKYEVKITLVDGENSEVKTLNHSFKNYNLLGDGELNNLNYIFGFHDGSVAALWNYNSYELPSLNKENKIFVGWYSDEELTEFIGRNTILKPTEDITLYAKFEDGKLGDINGDNEIDITDLVILGRYLVDLEEIDESLVGLADINRDSEVDITDLVILGRYLVGLEEIN